MRGKDKLVGREQGSWLGESRNDLGEGQAGECEQLGPLECGAQTAGLRSFH